MPKRSKTEEEVIEDNFSFSSDSDDDAPAELTTSNIRKDKLSLVQNLRKQEQEAKDIVKQKRRHRDELFKAQKKQKALPADVLEAVSSKKVKIQKEDAVNDGDGSDGAGEEDDLSGSEFGDDFDDMAFDKKEEEDFISLDSENDLKVVTTEAPKHNKSSIEKALAFKTSRLYSIPGTAPERETAPQRRNRLLKKTQLKAVK